MRPLRVWKSVNSVWDWNAKRCHVVRLEVERDAPVTVRSAGTLKDEGPAAGSKGGSRMLVGSAGE